MSSEQAVYRRVARRELHSSRAGAAIALAVFLVLLLAGLGAVCVLLAAHASAVSGLSAWLSDTPRFPSGARYAAWVGGIAAAIVGVVLIVLGAARGRRPRRPMPSDRVAAVADERVIANALAARAASASGVAPGQVRVVIGRRRVTAHIVPTSGARVDSSAVTNALAGDAAGYGLTRPPRVVVAEHGVVGR